MKKFFLALVFIYGVANNALGVEIKSVSQVAVGKSRNLTGVMRPFAETATFTTVIPNQLTYWKRGATLNISTGLPLLYVVSNKGKWVEEGEADYTFKIVCQGIQNLKQGNPKPFKNNLVVEFTYNFQCELQVVGKDGHVLNTFVLNEMSTLQTAVVHAGFLSNPGMGNYSSVVPPSPDFVGNNTDILNFIATRKEDIRRRIEFNQLHSSMRLAQFVIASAYGNQSTSYGPYIITAKHKKDDPEFAEFDAEIAKLTTEITEAFLGPIGPELQEKFLMSASYFAAGYDKASSGRMTQATYSYNAAVAYLLGGETEKAYEQYKVATAVVGSGSVPMHSFDHIYFYLSYMNYLKANSTSVVFHTPPAKMTAVDRLRMETGQN